MSEDRYHLILGIESSCDETAASVVRDGREVLSNVISTQIPVHQIYGGVVPEIASRKHLEAIDPVILEALSQAGVGFDEIDAVAVTYGPGLVGALLVGLSEAKALAYALHKPLLGVNHMMGHIAADYLTFAELEPPFLCMVVSGGHTNLIRVEDYNKLEVLGGTRDDAAGEAFDKVSRALGLGYPGGPMIQKAAEGGDVHYVKLPHPALDEPGFDFSFSGLKTAVLNYLNQEEMAGRAVPGTERVRDVAASFQQTVVDILVAKTMKAAEEYAYQKVAMAGGVSANSPLRESLRAACEEKGYTLYVPRPIFCTDNAAMIACAGYYAYKRGEQSGLDLNADPNLEFECYE